MNTPIQASISLKLLNIQNNSLKFTLETEIDGQLPFLDLKITRNSNRLTFGMYRKPTHTECYINSNGYNPKSQQHAVFNSLVYRLLNILLEQTEYTRHYEHILNTAVTNGFDKKLVDKKIKNFRRLKQITN